ncbi:hypothetical protein D7V86_06000 [bacterium D16-51]|nr:hypothetical protein D7V96_06675 [bacterium D16-59]RKI61331.1 hypothetical protein D7V86_06000 [bacterium D16-51]
MKTKIIEFRESVGGVSQEHLQEEEKLKENFKNASGKILSSIESEREGLINRQKDTEAELKRIRIQINLKKQQYNKSMQESDGEKTRDAEKELLELAEQERILALRKDTLSDIAGCDNEHTRASFSELYALYIRTRKEENEIHGKYGEILKELESLKETLGKEIEKIKHINLVYDMDGSDSGIDSNYAKYDVVKAFEIIHGKMKEPDGLPWSQTWDTNAKLRTIDKIMAKKSRGETFGGNKLQANL